MACEIFPLNSLPVYRYVVVLSFREGKILLSRHRQRSTWETQGGHIESGESPLAAARRELWEESGASDYEITPLCDYRFGGANGQVFLANIRALSPLPPSEMAEARSFDALPENLTYPAITPVLFAYADKQSRESKNSF